MLGIPRTYKVLFFDLDGTLLDFNASEQEAFGKLCLEKGLEPKPEYLECYHVINDDMWKQLERGEITRKTLQSMRFSKFFEKIGMEDRVNGEEDIRYRTFLSQSAIPLDGAEDILKRLAQTYPLYLVSNGNTITQNGRLDVSGFRRYFQGIFLSEEVGYAKPDSRFFDVCLSRMPEVRREDILLIGDSMSSDMAGGRNAGIDTCWYHPEGEVLNPEIPVTCQIQKLEELFLFL